MCAVSSHQADARVRATASHSRTPSAAVGRKKLSNRFIGSIARSTPAASRSGPKAPNASAAQPNWSGVGRDPVNQATWA